MCKSECLLHVDVYRAENAVVGHGALYRLTIEDFAKQSEVLSLMISTMYYQSFSLLLGKL